MSDLLFTFLQDRDVDCPNCKYNLRDLTSNACPECGLIITLSVQLAEPKLAAFIAGLVPLAMSAGFSGLLFLYGMAMNLVYSYLPSEFFLVTVVPALVSGCLLLLWIRWRRWTRRWPRRGRIIAIIFCWLIPILNLIFFISIID